jgi:hypothetical protein
MEIKLTTKDLETNKSESHYVICWDLIQGIEDFCNDFGININDIVAIVVIEQ